jgi:hypothetical protein
MQRADAACKTRESRLQVKSKEARMKTKEEGLKSKRTNSYENDLQSGSCVTASAMVSLRNFIHGWQHLTTMR